MRILLTTIFIACTALSALIFLDVVLHTASIWDVSMSRLLSAIINACLGMIAFLALRTPGIAIVSAPTSRDAFATTATSAKTVVGICVSVLAAVFFSFYMATLGGDPKRSVFVWLLFVVCSGLLIEAPRSRPLWVFAVYSIWPSFTFFFSSAALLLLAVILRQQFGVSFADGAPNFDDLPKFWGLYLVAAALAVPLIAAASIGRSRIFALVGSVARLDPKRIETLKVNLSLILALVSMLLAFFVGQSPTSESLKRTKTIGQADCPSLVPTMPGIGVLMGTDIVVVIDPDGTISIPMRFEPSKPTRERVSQAIRDSDKKQLGLCVAARALSPQDVNRKATQDTAKWAQVSLIAGALKLSKAEDEKGAERGILILTDPGPYQEKY